jgi:hypothetical protein
MHRSGHATHETIRNSCPKCPYPQFKYLLAILASRPLGGGGHIGMASGGRVAHRFCDWKLRFGQATSPSKGRYWTGSPRSVREIQGVSPILAKGLPRTRITGRTCRSAATGLLPGVVPCSPSSAHFCKCVWRVSPSRRRYESTRQARPKSAPRGRYDGCHGNILTSVFRDSLPALRAALSLNDAVVCTMEWRLLFNCCSVQSCQ